ncbi:carboxymethylenebutenolidase [Longimycelium tulufanense]|uniref:Carboxymethylenebutenolidase n=1 Tax=Longimycelium tulufanense TaxID=907463 RepID=A0A8J3FUG1_9PSEU|nr:dienelactone hydrolase family protein [Longimycelium tulufanense]GGM58339.1 carboxymethylenebutenolidase [Longimycelium tulufanense]
MTEIRTETLPLTDGSELRLTVGEPESAVRGGLVVLHEARGVTDAVRDMARSLAAEGWLAVVPHLYHRDGADELDESEGEERLRDQVNRLSGESVLADTDASFVWLSGRGVKDDQMGVVGYGLGGSVAMVVAASRTLGAAVTIGGGGILSPVSDGLPSLVHVAGELTCPWLGIYTEADPRISAEEVEKLREAAERSEMATNVVRYPEPVDPVLDRARNAEDAWQRTLNWFDSHLR